VEADEAMKNVSYSTV